MNQTWTGPDLEVLEDFLCVATEATGYLPVVWADESNRHLYDVTAPPLDYKPQPWHEPSEDELVARRKRFERWGIVVEDDEVDEEADAEDADPPRKAEPKQAKRKTNRDSKTLSELELAQDFMETPEADIFLYADGLGWRRYEKGRWRDGAHELYQSLSAFVRDRVETTLAARALNKHSVIRSAMAHVAEHRAVPADSFDADPLVVAFPDGTVLDAATWTRRPATPGIGSPRALPLHLRMSLQGHGQHFYFRR